METKVLDYKFCPTCKVSLPHDHLSDHRQNDLFHLRWTQAVLVLKSDKTGQPVVVITSIALYDFSLLLLDPNFIVSFSINFGSIVNTKKGQSDDDQGRTPEWLIRHIWRRLSSVILALSVF